jgi:peptidoglycan/xylan/chitin deacetylase (PgdA/CDA1 family)
VKWLYVLALSLILSGCGAPPVQPVDNDLIAMPPPLLAEDTTPGSSGSIPAGNAENYDYLPNEAGKIMVLMYHEIGAVESEWTRTPDNFRQDLLTLYEKGYRPVHLNDYLAGHITVPAGTTPFILTFDDGTAGQFRFIEKDNERVLDPDCAVAILLEMGEKYEDFIPAATFYIYYPLPFRQKQFVAEKLQLLTDWGFEIGNHAYNHENLARVTQEVAVKSLARHIQQTGEYLPDYTVTTLALPYGARPRDDSYIIRGSWEGHSYHHQAILLVGANPAPSPFVTGYTPSRLPRIRADGTELPRWLDYFAGNPRERFISDGNPLVVTVPEILADRMDENNTGGRPIIQYSLK